MGGPGDPKIDTFRAHLVTLSLGPFWGRKWSQNGFKMEPKWEQNEAQMETKCIRKRIKHQFDLFVFFIFICLVFVG